LTPKRFHQFDEFLQRAKMLKDEIHYHDDAMIFIAQVRDENIRRERVKKMFPKGIEDSRWNSLLKMDLYSYQKQGALFAASAGRCLIADEMGLGKTIQAIAAGEIMAQCFGIEKVLVICPTSLKYQWKQEIEKLTDRGVQLIQGYSALRRPQYREEKFFKIVNYDVVHRDFEAITQWAPDLIILDEAQRIKNWKTRTAQTIKQLKFPYAIVLTGTPLENRLEELHSIVEFIDRHHLGPLFRFLGQHQVVNETGKVVGYKNLHGLGRSLENMMIRRQRKEVLKQLPPRMDKNHFVPMLPEQIEIHEENRETVARLVSKWRRYHFLTDQEKQCLMACLQRMRMVCDNTYLVDSDRIHGRKVEELEIQLKEVLENPEAKVVIFSQWLKMMDLVTMMLKVNSWKYVFLHGGVASHKRGDLIKAFRDDQACRLFLSTEAGGVGLNLQNAAVVINMDLPWNPAVLEQRISRVYRLGQKQPVRVINFIAQGGIEHGMLDLLKFKRSMFSGVLDEGDNEVFMGTTRFNQFMKTVEEASQSVDEKKDLLNVTTVEDEKREKTATPMTSPEETFSRSPQPGDSFKTILQMAGTFLNELSECFDGQKDSAQDGKGNLSSGLRISTDEKTGRRNLQIPLPEEKTLIRLAETLESFLGLLKSKVSKD